MKQAIRMTWVLMAVGLFALACTKTEAKTTDIRIETAVCGMCADNIETATKNVDGVKAVTVDLDKKIAHVTYNANQTSVATIENAIAAAGYAANDKLADASAYEALPGCCRMDL